jgi:ADP-heptose:LPS heptosyltransferase
MASRLGSRISIAAHAAWRRMAGGPRARPASPSRVLIAHHLLLGDTLMLTPLLAKLRARHPGADITMVVPNACAALYAHRPYGIRAIGWNPRDPQSVRRLLREDAAAGFDLALIPGDNRHSLLAQAMGARWIVAFDEDRPSYRSWMVDELHRYPDTPGTWADITATLIDGPPPAEFRVGDWKAPDAAPFEAPSSPYCVLHVGASSRRKLWEPGVWISLAANLRNRGLAIAWSAGPGEEPLVAACDPQPGDRVTAGRLELAQVWQLLAGARLLVCPDTGVAHMGRIAGTPTIALFGPGSAMLAGAGDFWRSSRYRALNVAPFPCRDQHLLFKRHVAWVQICKRSTAECASPRCMQAIGVDAVIAACDELLAPDPVAAG